MVLLVREEAGLTKKIRQAVAAFDARHATPCLIDGPYGGILKTSLANFEHVVLCAGGSGISFVLPVLQDLVERIRAGEAVCRSVEVVWSIKEAGVAHRRAMWRAPPESECTEAVAWIADELRQLFALVPPASLSVRLHVTGSDENASSDGVDASAIIKSEKEGATQPDFVTLPGRPNLPALLASVGREQGARTVGVAGALIRCRVSQSRSLGPPACGPPSLLYDVRTAVASLQKDIFFGRSAGPSEVFLHTEEFTW
jgi:hypothetical protein